MKLFKSLLASAVSLFLGSVAIAAPPAPPQNVQQAWLGLEALLLWDESPDATSYRIYRADNTNTTWTLAGSSTVPRFRDATFEFLPSFYVVTAVNADGESAGSELSTVAFADQYTFTVYEPHEWEGTLSPTNAIVRWYPSDPNGAQGLVDWGLDPTNYTFFAINTNYLAYQQFDLSNLSPTTVYYYRITSISSNRAGVVYSSAFWTPNTNPPPIAEDVELLYIPPGIFVTTRAVLLRGHDTNTSPGGLTFRIVDPPTNGTLSAISPANFYEAWVEYNPFPGARGLDHFRYVANDGTWDSAPALVTITNWINTPPMATNAQFTTLEDTPIHITLPEFDAEGDPVTFRISDFVWNGSVTGTPPNITFIPNHDFNGSTFFSYTVNDGYADNYGWMQIDITPVNDKPVILTNIIFGFNTWEDQPVNIWLFVYDADWTDGYEVVQVIPPAHGTLSGDLWNLYYTPETNFFGTDYFTISVREGDGATSDPATFPVQVQPLNDSPVGFDQNVTGLEDVPLVIVPTGYDVEGDSLTFSVASYPTNGWVQSFETNFVYHPYTNFVGQDAFSFYARDWSGIWSWEPSWIRIQVVDANDAPDAHDVYPFVHAEATFTGSFSVSDPEGGTLTCEVVNAPANGTVTVSGTNFNYTPFAGVSQMPDNFTYRATDGLATSAVATVWIWIGNTNTVPEARDQVVSITQDTVTFFVLDVFDPDSEPLQTLIQSGPTNGTVEFELAGATYRPAPNFLGSDSFSYRIWDRSATSAVATVSINVVPPNVAPVAYNTNLMTQRDVALTFTLLASDGDGNALTYIVTSSPAHGSLSGTAPNLVYTPAAGFMGTDSFTFKANDGTVDGNTATVTITTTRPNVAPTAASQSLTTAEDTSVAITLSGADGDGDPLTFTILSSPSHGTLSGTGANRTYTPAANYNGADSFTFTVNDGLVDGNTATVSLTITPVNDAPVLLNPTTVRTLPEEWVAAWNPLATDPDGDPITFRLVTPPSHGTLDTTNWLYRAAKDYNGGDYFSWVVNDGQADSALGTFSVSITPVNDAPVATNQSVIVDTEISSVITPNVTDVDNSSLTLTVTTQPQHGTVTVNGMTFTYQPIAGYNGGDSFSYRASDGSLNSAIATVSISVAPINNPPVRVSPDRGFTITEDWYSTFNTLASDADGDLLTYRIVTQPTHGTVTQLSSNTWRYQPAWNWYGDDLLTWVASDGEFDCAIGTVWFHVVSQNDRPMSGYDILTNAEDSVFSVTLWSGDVDGDALTYTIITAPTNGVLSGSGSNRIYTPNPNFVGGDSLVFKVNDGQMDSFPGMIWFTVTNVNDVPIANPATITTAEDTAANITLTGSDVEGDALTFAVVTGPANGTLSGAAPNLVYTPNANFFGSDAFTFSVSDGSASSAPATVNITVTPVNDLPAPENLRRRIYSDRIVRLWWNEVPGAQSYLIYRADETNGPFTLLASGITTTNFNDATAAYQHTYWYRVSAWDGAAEGQQSSTVLARPDDTGLITLFMNEWVIRGRTAIVHFVTSSIEGTEGIFEYGTNRDYGVFLENTNIYGFQRFYLSNLQPATVYYFRITATDARGNAIVSTTNLYLQDHFVTQSPPIAFNQTNSIYEDSLYGSVQGSLTGGDADGFWTPLTFAVLTLPSHGTLTMLSETSFNYTPETNFNGIDSFTFKVNNGELDSAPGTVAIEVVPVNDGPIVSDITVGMMEDTSIVIPITATDLENDAILDIYFGSPLHGTATVDGTNIIYTPAADFFGADEFYYEASDTGYALGNRAWIHVNVTSVNDAPVANAQNVTTAEGTGASITLTGSDADGDVITYSITSGPSNGTLSGTAPNLTYTPAANYFGNDSFVFSVLDGTMSATATVSITVTAVSDLSAADGLRRRIDSSGVVHLWWNAVQGAASYNIYRAEEGGSYALLAGGVAETNYFDASAEFQHTYLYFVTTWDGAAEGPASSSVRARWDDTGVITLNVNNWVIRATSAQVQFCSSLAAGVEGIWEYGTTTNYDAVLENTNLLGCQHFTLSNLSPQTVYYYRLTATDSNGNAIVYWNSFATDGAPIAEPQSVSLTEDGSTDITLAGHNANYGPYLLSYSVVTTVSQGTLSSLGPNTFRYRPATNYNGSDSFTFKVNNGELDSAPATVSITVNPMNDLPVTANISRSTAEDTATTIPALFTDVDGGPVTIAQIVSQAAHGTAGVSGTNLLYFPATNYVGTDSFTYRISDGYGAGNTATVSLTITNVEDSPIAFAQSVTASEDVNRIVTLAGIDPDGDAITFLILSSPSHGTLTGTAPNVTYRAATNYNGSDSFTFRTYDGKSFSAPATVSITVTPVNDAPIASNIVVTVAEDTAMMISPAFFDADGEFVAIEPPVQLVSLPAHGTAWTDGFNMFYRPATNYTGADSFTYHVTDGQGFGNTATVSISVTPVNDTPVANNSSRTFAEDTINALTLSASDVDGDTLTFSIVTMPLHGTLSGTGAGRTYTPAANYNGPDSFTFRATDPTGASSDAVVSITLTPANDRPVGVDETVGLVEETSLWFVPTATDVDGDSIGFVIIQPMKGTAVVTNGGILYTPGTNYFGNDILYYYPTDAISTGALTVIVFNITNVNDAPTANDRTATTAEDTAVNIALSGSDLDNDALTFTIISGPTNGTLSGTGASRTYTPAANYNGSDSFTYLANDGTTNSGVATVSITVTPVNDAPSLLGLGTVIDEDTPYAFTLIANDADNDPLTYAIISNPSHGTLTGTGPTFTYTPSLNYTGPDVMIIQASDGTALSAQAYVNLTMRSVNDAPVANPQTVSVNEDSSVVITLTGSDVEGDALSYTRLSNPAHGTVTGTPLNITSTNAVLTYTPAANYNGPDSFTFMVHDGRTNSTVATVTIDVIAVNEAPVANAQSVTVIYNTAKAVTLTGADFEGSALTYSIENTPTNGTLTGTAPNITYTPNVGSAGADQFTFRVNDGGSNSDPATVSITTLNPVAIPPAPTSLAVTVPTATGTLILNWSCTATNEDGFKIERSLNSGSGWSQIATTGINIHTFTNTGLTSGTRYYYRVRSYNRLGNSTYSNTKDARPR